MTKKTLLAILIVCGFFGGSFYIYPNKEKKNPEKCKITIKSNQPDQQGLVQPEPGVYKAKCGTKISIIAASNQEYQFDYWEGVDDRVKNKTEIKVTVDYTHKTIVAHFKKIGTVNEINHHIGSRGQGENPHEVFNEVPKFQKEAIPRGTIEQVAKLSNYLYYFKDRKFRRLNTSASQPSETIIWEDDIQKALKKKPCYTTFIYPDERNTGNRFIVFYNVEDISTPSFIFYDKLINKFDINSFQSLHEVYKKIENIYPVDYSTGGEYIHLAFITVFLYEGRDDSNKWALVRYDKAENGKFNRTELTGDVISHYYNPYEKKLVWLRQESANKLELQCYDVPNDIKEKAALTHINRGQGYDAAITFMAYNYLVINFINLDTEAGSMIHRLYHTGIDTHIEEFRDSKLFS